MAPRVSVIIPCYNKVRHLEQTLQSVFAQSFDDWELIAVDDGSTDGTDRVLRDQGERVKALFGPNRGVSAARQRGLEAASGEFIQYVDADDLLAPGALGSRVAALDESGADVAYGDWQRLVETSAGVFEEGEIIARQIEDVDPDPELATFGEFWLPPVGLLYHRRIVERIGPWASDLPVIQDARYLQEAALHGARFVHVPGVSAYYRVAEDGSLSRESQTRFARDVLRNNTQIEARWRGRGGLTEAQRCALASGYGYVARACYREDRQSFRAAVAHLYDLEPNFRPSWPKLVHAVDPLLGKRATLRLLALLGRAAP